MYFRAPHQQQRGAAAPTSQHCQRLCKGLLGPQVSFEKARCHYVRLKMRSLKQNEMGEVKVLKDLTGNLHRGLTETNLFLPLHKACFLTLPIPIHTHTSTGICIHENTNKSQGKWNNPLRASALPSHVLVSLLHTAYYPKYSGWLMLLGDVCLCWPVQVVTERVWKEGSLALIALLKVTDSVIGSAF